MTLDAGGERINRPVAGYSMADIIASLCALPDLSVQSCFIDGEVSNVDGESVARWSDLVGKVGPKAVQIYTIDRQPARAGIRPVQRAQLEEIACLLRERAGIEAGVFA